MVMNETLEDNCNILDNCNTNEKETNQIGQVDEKC